MLILLVLYFVRRLLNQLFLLLFQVIYRTLFSSSYHGSIQACNYGSSKTFFTGGPEAATAGAISSIQTLLILFKSGLYAQDKPMFHSAGKTGISNFGAGWSSINCKKRSCCELSIQPFRHSALLRAFPDSLDFIIFC